jgi:hypothetical protein
MNSAAKREAERRDLRSRTERAIVSFPLERQLSARAGLDLAEGKGLLLKSEDVIAREQRPRALSVA